MPHTPPKRRAARRPPRRRVRLPGPPARSSRPTGLVFSAGIGGGASWGSATVRPAWRRRSSRSAGSTRPPASAPRSPLGLGMAPDGHVAIRPGAPLGLRRRSPSSSASPSTGPTPARRSAGAGSCSAAPSSSAGRARSRSSLDSTSASRSAPRRHATARSAAAPPSASEPLAPALEVNVTRSILLGLRLLAALPAVAQDLPSAAPTSDDDLPSDYPPPPGTGRGRTRRSGPATSATATGRRDAPTTGSDRRRDRPAQGEVGQGDHRRGAGGARGGADRQPPPGRGDRPLALRPRQRRARPLGRRSGRPADRPTPRRCSTSAARPTGSGPRATAAARASGCG